MSTTAKQAWFHIAIGIILIVLLLKLLGVSRSYPYYFMGDMDCPTAQDVVLIHSDLLPDHINHPGFGMYLLQSFTTRVGAWFNRVSALTVAEVEASLNPLLPMAEMTGFLRLHSPFLVVLIVFLLWWALCSTGELSYGQKLLALLVLALQESLVYHASIVRSELYAVFYWSGAVLLVILAGRALRRRAGYFRLFVGGVALGLCFLTKLQALFYVMAIPFLLALIISIRQEARRGNGDTMTVRRAYGAMGLSVFNLMVFLAVGAAAYATDISGEFDRAREVYQINAAGVMFVLAFGSLLGGNIYLLVRGRAQSEAFRYLLYLSILAVGFEAAFCCHFLLYNSAELSWRHLLYDYKMLFIRQRYSGMLSVWEYVRHLGQYVRQDPAPYLVFAGLTAGLVVGAWRKCVAMTQRQVLLIVAITVIVVAHLAVGTRQTAKDELWREIIVTYVSLFYFGLLVTRAVRCRRGLVTGSTAALGLLVLVNSVRTYDMSGQTELNAYAGGWDRTVWRAGFFDNGNQVQFDAILGREYETNRMDVLERQAEDYDRIGRNSQYVLNNRTVSLRDVGVVWEGLPVWRSAGEYKIAQFPPILGEAIVVDCYSSVLEQGGLPGAESPSSSDSAWLSGVNEHRRLWPVVGGVMRRLGVPIVPRQLRLLGRNDLSVSIFVGEGDVSGLETDRMTRTGQTITLSKGSELVHFYGLEIKGDCRAPLARFSKRFFIVIRPM